MNYNITIDLKKIRGAFVTNIQGKTVSKQCLCIPVENLFTTAKGAYFADFTMLEKRTPGQYGDTHFIKEHLNKDTYNSMSEEERKNMPIVGNVRPVAYGDNVVANNTSNDDDLGF